MRPASPALLLAVLVALPHAAAQLPVARLLGLSPAGARIGATNEIDVSGSDLDGPVALRFSDPRIVGSAKEGAPGRFLVVVPDSVPPGIVDARFEGRFGLSNPRAVAVDPLPTLPAPSTNSTPESAAALERGTVVDGRVPAGGVSWFRFAAAAGERLRIRVEAAALDSRLSPDLVLFHADGRELAVARRRERLEFTAPSDGPFRLRLADAQFRGGDGFHYRLRVESTPLVAFTLPVSVQAGRTNRVSLYGHALPGGQPAGLQGPDGTPLERVEADFAVPPEPAGGPADPFVGFLRGPASAFLARDTWTAAWHAGGSGAVAIGFHWTTNTVIAIPTNHILQVVPPCEASGMFPGRGEVAGVSFQAAKGTVWWIEVVGDRMSPDCDPHAVVQRERTTRDAAGNVQYAVVAELGDTEQNVGDREFNTSHRDATVRFEAPETGRYRVLVRDLFHLGPNPPRRPFRVSIRPARPDFDLAVFVQPPPRVGEDRNLPLLPVDLRRGQTVALKVVAQRRDGFDGAIDLSATNLPAGLRLGPARIAAGQHATTVLLTAGTDAAVSGPWTLTGTASVDGSARVRTAAGATLVWAVGDHNQETPLVRLTRGTAAGVLAAESAPATVRVGDGAPLAATEGGLLRLPVRVVRHPDFPAGFNLRPAGHPAFEKAKEIAVPEKAGEVAAEVSLAENPLPPGVHTLWLQGSLAGKHRNQPEALAAAEAALKEADQALAAAGPEAKPKAEERRKAAEAVRKAAEDRARPRDATVPVWSEPFTVRIDPKPAAPEAAK